VCSLTPKSSHIICYTLIRLSSLFNASTSHLYEPEQERDKYVILAVKAVELNWIDIRDSNITKLNIIGVRQTANRV
jgi:hypothetical protein